MRTIISSAVALLVSAFGVAADPAGDLLEKLVRLNNLEISDQNGFLFKSWLQFDEDNLSYIIYLNERKYDVIIDDGRGTSKRAASCKKENVFDENPATGCHVSFDAEYLVEDNGGAVEVSLKIWNVEFKD